MQEMVPIIIDTLCGSALSERIAALYLLGSAAKGTMRPGSDIDIAILPRKGISFSLQNRLSLIGSLSQALRREVDLGLITQKNLIYASEAILTGKRILALDPAFADQTEIRLLGEYLQFRLDRREVEEAYDAA